MKQSFLVALTVIFLGVGIASAEKAHPIVVMETSKGTIEIELYPEKSPITVDNFLKYVKAKHYDGLIFHRVIERFMIQGGGFDTSMTMSMPAFEPIENESKNGVSNKYGTIAMARTRDPHSASSQFFINTKDNTALDGSDDKWGYAVFGKVIKGMDVVTAIERVPTVTVMQQANVPRENIIIKTVRVKN